MRTLRALRTLVLGQNRLKSLPANFGLLPALEELILYSNELTSTVPSELGSTPRKWSGLRTPSS